MYQTLGIPGGTATSLVSEMDKIWTESQQQLVHSNWVIWRVSKLGSLWRRGQGVGKWPGFVQYNATSSNHCQPWAWRDKARNRWEWDGSPAGGGNHPVQRLRQRAVTLRGGSQGRTSPNLPTLYPFFPSTLPPAPGVLQPGGTHAPPDQTNQKPGGEGACW